MEHGFGLPPGYAFAPFDTDGTPSTFSASELAVVQDAWQRVAEDYAPFDVDVTTGTRAPQRSIAAAQAIRSTAQRP